MTDAPKIGKAFIEIRGDSSSLAKDTQSAGSTILAALKSFGPAIAAAVGGWSLAAAIKDAANFGDEMYKTSQKIGISVRELSSLNDDPEQPAPVVTRLVVPLTEPRPKRRFWNR